MSGAEDNAPAPRDLQVDGEEVTVPSQASASDASGHAESGSTRFHSAIGHSALLNKIQKLRADQELLRAQKKILAKDMENAQKKKRFQTRAVQLSDSDLVEVLRMRKARKAGEGSASAGQE